jgi:hypothetical protein
MFGMPLGLLVLKFCMNCPFRSARSVKFNRAVVVEVGVLVRRDEHGLEGGRDRGN